MSDGALIVTKDVTLEECPWLDAPVKAGTRVYRYTGATYGVIGPTGIAISFTGPEDTPFSELPRNALGKAEVTP